jgi:hypothetical protein
VATVSATITIDSSPDVVFGIMLDIADYPSWQGGVDRIEILDTDPEGRPGRTRWHVRAMGQRATHSVQYTYPADGCLEYHLVDSEVLTKYDFGCRVVGAGNGSEVTISQELAVKWPMPQAILDKNAKKGINKLLEKLKAKAEEKARIANL